MSVQPYLIFGGRAEEAIDFYQRAIGATRTALMRFRDVPPPPAGEAPPAGCAGGPVPAGDVIIHASFVVRGSEILCSDGMPGEGAVFSGFSLTLPADDEAQARRDQAALADGGQVTLPLAPTFFSPCFGMVVDRFGVSWMNIVVPPAQGDDA